MLYSEPIEVDYIRLAPDDAIVFKIVLKFLEAGTDLPVDRSVTEAGFHINTGKKQYLTLTLGEGLGWDDTEKALVAFIRNSQVSFIREDSELEYEGFVVWDDGYAETIMKGTVEAVRVG